MCVWRDLMGVSYRYAKNVAKTGTKLLIGLLVFDTAYTLIRYILYKVKYHNILPEQYLIIERIITNTIFTVFIGVLAAGMLMLGLYYFKVSKWGFIVATILVVEIGIKIAFIFYQFSLLLIGTNQAFIEQITEIFQLSTALLFIFTFILNDFFQRKLKKRVAIGYGKSMLPYVYGLFALIYPITNILNLLEIDYLTKPVGFAFMHLFSYFAAILGIILFFDLLRRFDHFQTLPEQSEEEIIELKVIREVREERKTAKK
ncbi:MAG: hypothetical protein K9W42_10540 [Candidatus Heimdallarchaeota archaeon]|nr:hypothetical protein [Candidatus Heimdallarchaeota archaeon]